MTQISPADDIAQFLVAHSIGFFGGSTPWAINVGIEPQLPNEAITIYDTGGLGPDCDDQSLLLPTFQVRVRGPNFQACYAKQVAIRDLLILTDPLVTANSRFDTVAMTSDILMLGQDQKNLTLLTANYRAIRERT